MTLTKNQLETRGDGEEGTEGNDNLQKKSTLKWVLEELELQKQTKKEKSEK